MRGCAAAMRRGCLPGARRVPILRGMETFTVTLNGQPHALGAQVSVAELLRQIGLDGRKVAVERNEEIVPRSTYAQTVLAAGDAIEIVHFIGGG